MSESAERPADVLEHPGGEPPAGAAPIRWPVPPPFDRSGTPAPTFQARSSRNSRFMFSSAAGRHVALCFIGPRSDLGTEALRQAMASGLFHDENIAAMFAVSTEPRDEVFFTGLLRHHCSFWDHDLAISRAFRAVPADATPAAPYVFSCFWLLLDPMLRVVLRMPLSQTTAFLEQVRSLPPPSLHSGCAVSAPVLVVPRVFEPDLCAALIELYERSVSEESGFMVDQDGKTIGRHDSSYKRRRDCMIDDEPWRDAIRQRLTWRLFPEIAKAFQFQATRIERYMVARYDSATGGFFRPHRDNTSPGTKHRKFAVTINLDADAHEGGDLCFPEFGDRTYRAPTGAAIVFSCSLMHEARPVTSGVRYACLPFLYDDAAARTRVENAHLIVNAPPAPGEPAEIDP